MTKPIIVTVNRKRIIVRLGEQIEANRFRHDGTIGKQIPAGSLDYYDAVLRAERHRDRNQS